MVPGRFAKGRPEPACTLYQLVLPLPVVGRNPTEPPPIREEKAGHRWKEEGQEGRRREYRKRRSRERMRSRKKKSETEERETKRTRGENPRLEDRREQRVVRPRPGN
ncbi:hypothetical protein NDU88_006713 [Pleurodeles waltl]|uniref:Uncharacterized protein n=1 Tax=Pleurodeles waltl TaxID=8319 RepID=A0AAV7RR15_PLEWA|nr:hypothetical protein NDU88_006713 [Pleurodeles waltl]